MKNIMRFVVFAILGSLCLGSAFAVTDADLRNGTQAYYTFDEDFVSGTTLIDSVDNYNGTITGATCGVIGIINESCSYDGTNDYVTVLDNTGLEPSTGDFSFSHWIQTSTENTMTATKYVVTSPFTQGWRCYIKTGGVIEFMFGDSAGNSANPETSGQNYADGNWHHVVGTWNSSTGTAKIYVDGNLSATDTDVNVGDISNSIDMTIGVRNTNLDFDFSGKIDEVVIYNRTLSGDEITELYTRQLNNLTGAQYDFTSSGTPIIQTNITDYYNSENISIQLNTTSNVNMSYILDSGNETAICTNCNNSILNLTNLSEGAHSILFVSTDENGQANTTANFSIDTQPANVSVNAFTEWNNGYNVTSLNATLNITCEDPNLDHCEIHWDDNTSTNIGTTQYKVFATNGNHTFSLHAHDLANNTVITNGTIFINPYQYFYFNDSNNTQITNFSINGTTYEYYFNFTVFDYGYGNHTFEFSKIGYETTSFTLELNSTSEFNTTYVIPGSRINIFIYDRTTRELINGTNITVELAGPSGAIRYTTTGTTNISSLSFTSGDYTILTSGSGYEPESKGFTFTNQEIINISVYMLESTINDTGIQNVYVENGFGVGIENILVKLNEWYSSEGVFVPVSEKISQHPFGKVSFDVEYKTKLYRICAYPDSGEVFCHEDTTLTASSDDIYIPILDEKISGTDFLYSNYSISCTNTSIAGGTQFDMTFADPTTEITKFCMVVFSKVNTTLTKIEEKCVNSYEGAISESYIHTNSTVMIAKGFAYIDSESISVCEVSTQSTPTLEEAVNGYGLEIILPVFFALFLCGLGYAKKKLWYAISGLNILMWCFAYGFPSLFTVTMALVVDVLSLVGFIVIQWRNNN